MKSCLRLFAALLAASAFSLGFAEREVVVLAAASLKEPFTELARRFEAEHPGAKVRLSFAGSQQLAAQIALGAPADAFASADQIQMDRVINSRRIERGAVRLFAQNELQLVVAMRSKSKVGGLKDLAKPGVKIVLATATVPAGHYTLEMLEKAATKFPRGWSAAVGANVVSRELDVRSVLAKVMLGEADAGIVYVTDARSASGKVVSRSIPGANNVRSSYFAAPIKGSRAGEEFIALGVGPDGRKALQKAGFIVPRPAKRP